MQNNVCFNGKGSLLWNVQLIQGKELQAYTRHWECISYTSEYFYRPIVESFHTLGFEETTAVDMSGITNCWLSNTWKQFWGSSFKYPNDMAGKNFHLKVDGAIVQPKLQLPMAEKVEYLNYLMKLLDIEVTWPFSFATLLMLYNQVLTAPNFSSLVDPPTRAP
jgi:hypothetical protein